MEDKELYKFWQDLDQLRGKHKINIDNFFKKFERPFSFAELKLLSNKSSYRLPSFIPSKNLVDFFIKLFKLKDTKSIFDPWLYPGSLSHQIAEQNNCNLLGTQSNQNAFAQFNNYYSDKNKKIIVNDSEKNLEALIEKYFDLIISLLPFGIRTDKN